VFKKAFVSKVEVKHHHQGIHGEVHPFTCDVCNKSFAVERDLKRHKTIHTQEKP